MTVSLLPLKPEQQELHDAVHNVVDLAWLTLVVRLREVISAFPERSSNAEAETLHRHFELLTVYAHAAASFGDTLEWTSETLTSELETAIAELVEAPGDHADALELSAVAVKAVKDPATPVSQLVDLAERCFGVLVSLEFAIPRTLGSLLGAVA